MSTQQAIKYFTFFLLLGIVSIKSTGQDPMYSQYMFNIQAYNPAYAGTWRSLGITALSRHQWVGFEGAPSTQTLSIQSPMKNNDMGLGLSVINDHVGKVNQFSVFADYAYGLKLTSQTQLRFGLKGGFTNYQHDLTKYAINDTYDELFQTLEENSFILNFGLGAFLHSELYYVGFSVPKLLQNEVRVNTNQFEMLHFTFIGGYVFDMSEMIKFKHSFNARFHKTLPMLIDINASVLLSNRFWIGAMYRSNNSFGFNTNYIIDDKLRIAYSYDFTNSRLSMFSNGTHEIMISYELTFKKDKFDSPRYF